ncbi:hypothetical protein [Candidatus Uabimicrobium amorphum]|uniref:Uncharacterized protein n=2 Tax=Uabimicrobium amorphum TaxID=2596890 RepID=A0A5S9IPZ5_UABAM|nr:hypothetical protein UABAM_02916 [Candidatus Uabimicrobium amorphum]
MANCRIGYPYASSDRKIKKDSIVILKASDYRGFTTVTSNKFSYQIPTTDEGPNVLVGFKKGVVGKLIESKDERQSIAKNGEIRGEGKSSQLAIVLACCAVYEGSTDRLPIILFSAAIDIPAGAKPFIGATINSYCTEAYVKDSLIHKYEAACMVGAVALVLCMRDAKILTQLVGKEITEIDLLSSLLCRNTKEPAIVGVGKKSLPDLASKIGINKYHYTEYSKEKSKYQYRKLLIFLAVCFVCLAYFIRAKSSEKYQRNQIEKLCLEIEGENRKVKDLWKEINRLWQVLGENPSGELNPKEAIEKLKKAVNKIVADLEALWAEVEGENYDIQNIRSGIEDLFKILGEPIPNNLNIRELIIELTAIVGEPINFEGSGK